MDSGSIFDDVSDQIAALVPGGGWQGAAAHAYLAQNLAQARHVKMMLDFDHQLAGLVSSQAEAVSTARTRLFLWMLLIIGTGSTCVVLEKAMGEEGVIYTRLIAGFMVPMVLYKCGEELGRLWSTTGSNAHKVQALTKALTDMMSTLPALPDSKPALPHMPRSNFFSEFDLADHPLASAVLGLTDDNRPLPGMADTAVAFDDLPGWPEFSVPDRPTPGFPDFGVPTLPIPQLTGVPSLPGARRGSFGLADLLPDPGGLPRLASGSELIAATDLSNVHVRLGLANPALMHTVDQLTATLSQLTQHSGAAGEYSHLLNPAAQQNSSVAPGRAAT